MEKTPTGFKLTTREALSAQSAAAKRGYPEFGRAATTAMIGRFTNRSGAVSLGFPSTAGYVRLRGALRNDGRSLNEHCFHIAVTDIPKMSAEDVQAACAPTDNVEREIDEFVDGPHFVMDKLGELRRA
jgi:hypothetical protein